MHIRISSNMICCQIREESVYKVHLPRGRGGGGQRTQMCLLQSFQTSLSLVMSFIYLTGILETLLSLWRLHCWILLALFCFLDPEEELLLRSGLTHWYWVELWVLYWAPTASLVGGVRTFSTSVSSYDYGFYVFFTHCSHWKRLKWH